MIYYSLYDLSRSYRFIITSKIWHIVFHHFPSNQSGLLSSPSYQTAYFLADSGFRPKYNVCPLTMVPFLMKTENFWRELTTRIRSQQGFGHLTRSPWVLTRVFFILILTSVFFYRKKTLYSFSSFPVSVFPLFMLTVFEFVLVTKACLAI